MPIVNKLLGLIRKDNKQVKVVDNMQKVNKKPYINEEYEVKILALIGSLIAYEWIGRALSDEFKPNLTKEETAPLSIAISREEGTEVVGDCIVTGHITSELKDLEMTIISVRKKGYLKSFSVTFDQINGEQVNVTFSQSPYYTNPGLTMVDITKKVTEDISLMFNKD